MSNASRIRGKYKSGKKKWIPNHMISTSTTMHDEKGAGRGDLLTGAATGRFGIAASISGWFALLRHLELSS